jgi:hypothetical protein
MWGAAMKKSPFGNELPKSEELLSIIVASEPVFCPSSERLKQFQLGADPADIIDLLVHLRISPCGLCGQIVEQSPVLSTSASGDERRGSRIHPDSAEIHRELHEALTTVDGGGTSLYQRLIDTARNILKKYPRLEAEPGDVFHGVLERVHKSIDEVGFRPNNNWEAHLTYQLTMAPKDLARARVAQRLNAESHRARGPDPADEAQLRERRARQYEAIKDCLSDVIKKWMSMGPRPAHRRDGLLRKAVFEMFWRGTGDDRFPSMRQVANLIGVKYTRVNDAFNAAKADFAYRLEQSQLSKTELSVMPQTSGRKWGRPRKG